MRRSLFFFFFFFNDTATTEIYTLSLHDALPIYVSVSSAASPAPMITWLSATTGSVGSLVGIEGSGFGNSQDRKSTRLNSSHSQISYAVFCLKKKKNHVTHLQPQL